MPQFMELFVVLVILVIVFGAKTLPRIGESIGRMIVRRRRSPSSSPEPRNASPEPRNEG